MAGKLEGRAEVMGLDTRKHSRGEITSRVAMVFDDPESQIFGLSVWEDMVMSLELAGLSREEIQKRVDYALERTRLTGYMDRFPYLLSGGEKQRLVIASALARMTPILVLDEPTSELDPIGTTEVFDTIKRLREETAMTIIVVSHKSEQLAQVADRLALMSDGQVKLVAPKKEFFSNVDVLLKSGVRPPQVAELGSQLKEKYQKIYGYPTDLEEARKSLKKIIKKRISIPRRAEKMPEADPLIIIKDLQHMYKSESGDVHAIKGVNLEIMPYDFIGLIGQNGAGKTTLVKHFNKLLSATEGNVIVDGDDASRKTMLDLVAKVAYSFQNPDHQIFNTKVEDEISFGPGNLGFSGEELEEAVDEAVEAVGLVGREEENPFFMGKGERQKVATASIIAMRPKLLVIDEPTTGMDWLTGRSTMEMAERLNKEGKAIIVITHDMTIVAEYAKRVIVMMQGNILLDGPPEDVFNQPEVLKKSFIEPPQISQLMSEFVEGKAVLSVREAAEIINTLEE
ncbi:MAG: ATP-binding cassette domain-containing protein [Candidatus Bathyarchaeota archaeon]|nr:MAG: ATP-binding cassette domain-containing protein [Candidatus Bathyarchaeota archaeon]